MRSKSILQRALTLVLGALVTTLGAVTLVSMSKTQQKVEAFMCGEPCHLGTDYCATNFPSCPYCANFGGVTMVCYTQPVS